MTDNIRTLIPRMTPLSEVAAQLGMPPRRLRDRRKEFTHVRIGKELYLTDDQLAALIKTFTVPSDRSSKRDADLAAVAERQARRQPRVPRQRKAA